MAASVPAAQGGGVRTNGTGAPVRPAQRRAGRPRRLQRLRFAAGPLRPGRARRARRHSGLLRRLPARPPAAAGSARSAAECSSAAARWTLYNLTLAYNQTGVVQAGGTVNAYNSLFADNGYTGNTTGSTGRTITTHPSGSGTAVAYNSLFGSPPVGMDNGGGSFIAPAGLAPGLAYNGGPTETIALMAGSYAIGSGIKTAADGTVLFTDRRGYVPTSASWDIGAYQSSGVPAGGPDRHARGRERLAAELRADQLLVHRHLLRCRRPRARDRRRRGGPGHAPGERRRTDHGDRRLDRGQWAGGRLRQLSVDLGDVHRSPPQGGSWTEADNGTYDVGLIGSPVVDALGQTGPSGMIGNFLVETGNIGITKFGLIRNPSRPSCGPGRSS